MKEYQIKRVLPEGSSYDNHYTTYRNPDPKLRKEIASFKLPANKVTLGWPEKEWTILEYEDKEVKCQSGRNISYFPIEDVKEALENNLKYERNQKYQPHNYFKKHFGVISKVDKHEKSMTVNRIDLVAAHPVGNLVGLYQPLDPTTVEFYWNFYKAELTWWDEQIKLEVSNHGSSLNIWFDENGDYVNRDYNENLNNFKNEDVDLNKVLDHLHKNLIKSYGKELMHLNGKYYTPSECLVPYVWEGHDQSPAFGINIYKTEDKGKTYKKWREKAIKRPKKLEPVGIDHLWNKVMEIMPKSYRDILAGVEVEADGVEL